MKSDIEQNVGNHQCGNRREKGTAIHLIRQIVGPRY